MDRSRIEFGQFGKLGREPDGFSGHARATPCESLEKRLG
jgi:hypothetical protein